MAITKIEDLNSLYNYIFEDALFVARESNLMTSLVRNFSATGFMARKIGIRPQITAETKAEGVDFQNPTTFGASLNATLTPAVVMAQVLLTDEDVDTDPSGARQDAAQELGGAIATKIDTDLVALFSSFTTGKGTAGNALTIAKCAAAMAVLRSNKAPNPLYFVLHPYGWADIWTELGQPAATYSFLGDTANQALRDYYVGNWVNATWFINSNIVIDSSDDVYGAVFNPNGIGFDSRQAPVLEPERDASRKATELNMSAGYAVGVIRADHGVYLLHDATEPTG